MSDFATELLDWYRQHGRHDLPWQTSVSPYTTWLSEIMLQQTQVVTVIPYFLRFTEKYPNVEQLAAAPLEDVLGEWSGLGYYARARNLHKAANIVAADYAGQFPETPGLLEQLPGIGRSTAAAILAQASGQRQPILDGNVKRVLARYFAVAGWPGKPAVAKQLWELSDRVTPQHSAADYTQAIMDLGATLCKRHKPECPRCPVQTSCAAYQQQQVDSYPGKKPKKVKPKQTRYMPIVSNPLGEILLERRPPSGIWGGLWSLPEFDSLEALQDWARDQGFESLSAGLPELKHEFSHYSLAIQPQLLRSDSKNLARIEDTTKHWQPLGLLLSEQSQSPLPAPIRKLLSSLKS